MAGKPGFEDTSYTFEDFTPITVTFSLNHNDVFAIQPSPQYLPPEGGFVIEPISPASEDYRFLGWYQDSQCTTRWNFQSNRVASDTTVYANWVRTGEAVPDAPSVITAVSASSNSVTIRWDAVTGATGYQVYVNGSLVTTSPVADTSYQITNLETDTTYEITVAAVNAAGVSAPSLVKVVSTTGRTMGDVNGDGFVDASDALEVLKHAANLTQITDSAALGAADIEPDGIIDASDALAILKVAAGLL